jgi:23S rRNA (uracil1939-C5)-methyltransferase
MPVADDVMLDLDVERAVAGGWMLARHDGQVVLVSGAIPGERVRARVTRRSKRVTLAATAEVVEASPDRREPACDLACGGSQYAHIQYARQLALKADVVKDAFRRICRSTLEADVNVAPSPESGYRLRATLHVQRGLIGFFREGSHDLCDAMPTGQLLPETGVALASLAAGLGRRLADCGRVVVAENIAATERVCHLEPRAGRSLDGIALDLARLTGVTGVTVAARGRPVLVAGHATVSDSAADVFGDDAPVSALAAWTRHAPSFFQSNRWLVGQLVRRVLDLAPGDRVVDLFAGVGLFAVALAARGSEVVAVEGDRSSGTDLKANAGPWRERLLVVRSSVEEAVSEAPAETPDVVVVDPPRTGLSPQAVAGLIAWRVPRLVYVSCDPPTLARDAAKLAEAGYHLASLEAFDLFPNSPHVETLAVFTATSESAPHTP